MNRENVKLTDLPLQRGDTGDLVLLVKGLLKSLQCNSSITGQNKWDISAEIGTNVLRERVGLPEGDFDEQVVRALDACGLDIEATLRSCAMPKKTK